MATENTGMLRPSADGLSMDVDAPGNAAGTSYTGNLSRIPPLTANLLIPKEK
jgi:hypothetical protein